MQRASLFILAGLIAVCLTGCQHAEEAAPAGPPPASGPAVPASPEASAKMGTKPTSAPTVGVNPDYNGPAMGSKGK